MVLQSLFLQLLGGVLGTSRTASWSLPHGLYEFLIAVACVGAAATSWGGWGGAAA